MKLIEAIDHLHTTKAKEDLATHPRLKHKPLQEEKFHGWRVKMEMKLKVEGGIEVEWRWKLMVDGGFE